MTENGSSFLSDVEVQSFLGFEVLMAVTEEYSLLHCNSV
jgi:hypothetical protein